MDSYRLEKQAVRSLMLAVGEAEIDPVPAAGGVRRLITETIPSGVAADSKYRNARRNSDEQNARIEGEKALARVMNAIMRDDMKLFRQYADDAGFQRWMTKAVLDLASRRDRPDQAAAP